MQTVSISDFRTNLLHYLEMANTGQSLQVTSHGRLLATIIPPLDNKALAKQKLQELAKQSKIGDVISPIW